MPSTAKPHASGAPDPDRYVRLPQAVLDRRKARHAQLLDAMQAQGFYTPSGAKKFSGYAELIRDFLYWYFGLTTGTMTPGVGATSSVPGLAGALRTSTAPSSEDLSSPDELASGYSDDLATGYFAR